MPKILLVDDSETVRLTIAAMLERGGFETDWSPTARVAWHRLADGCDFDMVITDLHMPGMSGLELVRAIRSRESLSKLVVLILTTERNRNLKMEARNAGANGWVTKPVPSDSLLKAVHMLLPLTPA